MTSERHDRPHAVELVTAVREFLEHDVVEATDGRVQFHTRVAVNALRMVERELGEGAARAIEHARRLDSLGVDDDEALARAIRDGTLDERWDEALAVVRASVIDKLRVANPNHLLDDEGAD